MKISYAQQATVIHAEVAHFGQCLYKLFECGQYSSTYSKLSAYRPLNFKEKVHVFRACITNEHYGPTMALILGGTLLTGWLFFEAGRLLHVPQASH
jgi:hypothetical protein